MPKRKPNAYFCFVIDYKSREEAKGRTFRDIDEVQRIVAPIWEKMNAEKRAPFIEKAKQEKQRGRQCGEKFTSLGVPFSQVEAEKRERELKTQRISSRIVSMVAKAVEGHALEKLEIYFISFGYFCVMNDGTYIPAEVGAVRYSLEKGIIDKFHMLINPGTLPRGMPYEAQKHSDLDHQLPIPPQALGETDFDKIAMKLSQFVNRASRPLLFTDREDVPKVEKMLSDIMRNDVSDEELLVCPLSELFFHLKKNSMMVAFSDDAEAPTMNALQQLITRDIYDYTPNISCYYHEKKGDGKYCSISRCVRWAFVISDNCCLDLNIDIQLGKHLPENANTELNLFTNTMDSASLSSMQHNRCSLSNSIDSSITYPTDECSRFSGAASSTDGKRFDSVGETHTSPGLNPWGRTAENQLVADKSEVHEMIKKESNSNAWRPSSVLRPTGRGRGWLQTSNFARDTINGVLGAGRGRKPREDFPLLVAPHKSSK